MAIDELLSLMKSNGAVFAPAAADREITLAGNGLQNIRAAILPMFAIDLYKTVGGIILGDAYVFGPRENKTAKKFPVPNILQINSDISNLPQMRGKTVFGRNDLFWFAFDTFGNCFMMDNTTLRPLRKYEEPWRALTDCLIAGKM
ncbi:MAG: hypothetical protein LBF28_01130 [Rickettsiales bacterium]|jgi:hypothetical protein|nr:hypothetical protein [Rickettsiales bacterium]